jgi:hypothetical protein
MADLPATPAVLTGFTLAHWADGLIVSNAVSIVLRANSGAVTIPATNYDVNYATGEITKRLYQSDDGSTPVDWSSYGFTNWDITYGIYNPATQATTTYTHNSETYSEMSNAPALFDPFSGKVDVGLTVGLYVTGQQFADTISSDNFSSGVSGWQITRAGIAEFQQVTVRGTIFATVGQIGGWTISSTDIHNAGSTAKLRGAGNLAFGATPPTSATVGTGIFIDSTGIYGLNANVQEFMLDAASGAASFNAGNITADTNGLTGKLAGVTQFILDNTGLQLFDAASLAVTGKVTIYSTSGSINTINATYQAAGSTSRGGALGLYSSVAGGGTGLTVGQIGGQIKFGGANGTIEKGDHARIESRATQTATSSHQGGSLALMTNPNNTTTPADALLLDQDQSATFAGVVGMGVTPTSITGLRLQAAQDIANMSNAGQIEATGVTAPAKRMTMGFDTTHNQGWLQASETSVAFRDILMQPGGGKVGIGLGAGTAPNSTLEVAGDVTISAHNIITDTSTGLKLGTATSQKLAFWNKTPIVQPTTGITGATRVGGGGTTVTTTDTFGGYTLAQLAAALINTGLVA